MSGEDFDVLTSLYKKIYHFLLLRRPVRPLPTQDVRCSSPSGEAKPPKDMAVEREACVTMLHPDCRHILYMIITI